MLLEGVVAHRRDGLGALGHGLGVDPDLGLGVPVEAQAEQVEEVVQIDLPVDLGVEVLRQDHARLLAADALGDHLLVIGIGALAELGERLGGHARDVVGQGALADLLVDLALGAQLAALGQVELVEHDRIAGAHGVQLGRAVPDHLGEDEERQLHVEDQRDLLEGARVRVAHEVVDQPLVLADGLGAGAVADAGGLDDAGVAAHVVDQAHEALVQHRKLLVEDRLGLGNDNTSHDQTTSLLAPPHRAALILADEPGIDHMAFIWPQFRLHRLLLW